jgi:hypothetical protein
MAPWSSSFGRSPRTNSSASNGSSRTTSVAFPHCNMRGGLCESLLSALPMAIVVIQFIRDGYDVVQDGVVVLANGHAASVFSPDLDDLTGSLFLQTCSESIPFGAWHKCLWVASSGKPVTLSDPASDGSAPHRTLTIAPYSDGLILCKSITPEQEPTAQAPGK